jgi:soluble lytic murein transglycosylase-like protein
LGWSVVSDKSTSGGHALVRGGDFRLICDCQRHSAARRGWRSALKVASRGAAVLVSIPLAFATLDLPTSAMNLNVAALRNPALVIAKPAPAQERRLAIFDSAAVREQFLPTAPVAASLPTFDAFKEQYFRDHVPYGSIIIREARRHDLSPELVAAMIHTESDFRPELISNKSAQGLMQIVPSTGRLLGINDPFDPQQNIAAGTKYFRYLLDRFDNETMALAAYNAGPGNVDRFGGVPPFPETQSYVTKVNRRTHRYRQRLHSTYLATLRVRRAH